MRRVRLGRTEVRVPVVSVGTWGHSGPRRVDGHAVGWGNPNDDAARRALIRAWELGLDHWDTADAYGDGHSEALIGDLWPTVPRDAVFLASKVGFVRETADHGYAPSQMRAQVEGSLRRLRTEVIDLFYLHHCDFGADDRYLEGAVELLHRLRDEGKVRWLGLSDWDAAKVARYAPRVEPDVVQVYRSVLHDTYVASGLAAWVEAHDLGACFFSPLQHGLLLGKLEAPPELDPGDHRSRRDEFRDRELIRRLRDCRAAVLERFADRPQPVLDALIGAVVADAPSACALLGMRRPEHVDAAAAVDAELTAADLEWVRRTYRGVS